MSPTSYQAAPPRKSNITAQLQTVKPANTPNAALNAASREFSASSDLLPPFESSCDPSYSNNEVVTQRGLSGRRAMTATDPLSGSSIGSPIQFPSEAVAGVNRRTFTARKKLCPTSNDLSPRPLLQTASASPFIHSENGARPEKRQPISPSTASLDMQSAMSNPGSPAPQPRKEPRVKSNKPRKADRDGLYQRPGKGSWYFRYQAADGNTFTRSTGCASYNEAKQEKSDFLKKLRKNELPNSWARWTLK